MTQSGHKPGSPTQSKLIVDLEDTRGISAMKPSEEAVLTDVPNLFDMLQNFGHAPERVGPSVGDDEAVIPRSDEADASAAS
jgi:hypothetical protein